MSPLLIWLLILPGVFLVLPLLSVATGLWCAWRMAGVSLLFGLLTGCAVGVVVGALMLFRAKALGWAESGFGVDLPWAFFPLLTVAIAVAGIIVTWGICRLRRAKVSQHPRG